MSELLFHVLFGFGLICASYAAGLICSHLLAAAAAGYVAYDCMHYASHYGGPVPHVIMKHMKRLHQMHHYKNHAKGYGISTPLFDAMFGTMDKWGGGY